MEEAMNPLRIYIGGLGVTVTANDLIKTFSSPNLGTVTAVDVIRSKGRSFAYLDFLPCSDKGLAKLFSTYNGCKWKGGSLRLEKAKEHYLQQLKREWEEDTELSSNLHKEDGDSVENVLPTVKSKKHPDMDKMQLNIFFPRLRKVKAVPFKGTGKHKYSFQRFEALAPPKYFCDCDDHSGAQDVDKEHRRNVDTKSGAQDMDKEHRCNVDTKVKEDSFDDHEKENENGEINEQELTMMSSVMNKLFEREVFSEATRKCGSSTMTFKNVNTTGDLASTEDQSDEMSDEDNLIINIVGGSKSNNASWLGNNLATSNQDLRLKELYNSKSRHQNLQTNKQKITVPVGEKRKQLKDDEKRTVSNVAGRKIRKILPSNKNEKANLSHSKGSQTSDISVSRKLSDGCENSAEPQTNVSETINCKPVQLQKSEKEGLSTEGGNSTFGISSSAPSGSPGFDFQSESDILGKPHTSGEDKNNSSLQIKEPKVSAEGLSGSGKMTADKSTKGASWLQKSSWTQLVKGPESSSFTLGISSSAPSGSPGIDFQSESDILGKPHTSGEDKNNSSLQVKEPKVSAEGSSGSGKVTADKSTKGASWLQKSSWTQLVKGSESSSFSISHILPEVNFDKQEIQLPTAIDFSRPNQTAHVPLPQGQSNTVPLGVHENIVGNTFASKVGNYGGLQADPEKNKIDGQVNEASTSSASTKQPLAAKQASTDADETFGFVRTPASMKEFAKIKASLSVSLKKKGDKKDI